MRFSLLEKFAAAVLAALWLVWGSHTIGEALLHVDDSLVNAALAAVTAERSEATGTTGESADEGGALAMLASVDAERGKKVFNKCKACHTPGRGAAHRIGPNLWDVVGRVKGGAEGFKFSASLSGLGGEWSYEALNAFLTKPKDFAPGNKMTFPGLKKAGDRAAVIVYLRSLSDSPSPLP
ncbi:MAG: cytochrome c family protein [Rhodospirillales bacterium]|jgi:cytochrome c|nr:cytochrome c family protein [Rhodospirillales bacterium]MDP6804414.1 cytochrome c family protein [Rhodospirillales bacterium]